MRQRGRREKGRGELALSFASHQGAIFKWFFKPWVWPLLKLLSFHSACLELLTSLSPSQAPCRDIGNETVEKTRFGVRLICPGNTASCFISPVTLGKLLTSFNSLLICKMVLIKPTILYHYTHLII